MVDSTPALGSLETFLHTTVYPHIKPGDAIAFSGYDIPSRVVKVATQSEYVHVAIVVSVDRSNPTAPAVMIAEAHVDTQLPSLGTGKRSLGVQLQWFVDRMMASNGPVWWAALKSPLSAAQQAAMQFWLEEQERRQVPYDFKQAIEVGLESLGWLDLPTVADSSAFFCSELVTRALQIAGALDHTINSAEQTPVDVMQLPCFERPILIRAE